MDLWRISTLRSLSGEWGRLYAGRWNSGEQRVVYLADSAAAALLEVLVHLEVRRKQIPLEFLLLRVAVAEAVMTEEITPPSARNWQDDLKVSRHLGDTWLGAKSAALGRVPSSILPRTWNYLLNPEHPDARKVTIAESLSFRIDPRLTELRTAN